MVHRLVTPSYFHNLHSRDYMFRLSAALLLKGVVIRIYGYSHFSPCRHLVILDTPLIWTAAESPAKIIDFRLKETSFCTDFRSLLQT